MMSPQWYDGRQLCEVRVSYLFCEYWSICQTPVENRGWSVKWGLYRPFPLKARHSRRSTGINDEINDVWILFSRSRRPGVVHAVTPSRLTGTLEYNRAIIRLVCLLSSLWRVKLWRVNITALKSMASDFGTKPFLGEFIWRLFQHADHQNETWRLYIYYAAGRLHESSWQYMLQMSGFTRAACYPYIYSM